MNKRSVKEGIPAVLVGKLTRGTTDHTDKIRGFDLCNLWLMNRYGFRFGEDLVFSGVTFSLFFNSVRIAFASAFIGFESGATSTKC